MSKRLGAGPFAADANDSSIAFECGVSARPVGAPGAWHVTPPSAGTPPSVGPPHVGSERTFTRHDPDASLFWNRRPAPEPGTSLMVMSGRCSVPLAPSQSL